MYKKYRPYVQVVYLIRVIVILGLLAIASPAYSAAPTNYDRTQDNKIKKNKDNIQDNKIDINQNVDEINNNSNKINAIESEINRLDSTQVNVLMEVDFIREKNYTIGLYSKLNMDNGRVPEIGLKISIGIGESWIERELQLLNKKIDDYITKEEQ